MKNFLLVDLANLTSRGKFAVGLKNQNTDDGIALTIGVILQCIQQAVKMFSITDTIICTEGKSWRKLVDARYKANRSEKASLRTPIEIEVDTAYYESFNYLIDFFHTKTNLTVLNHPQLEADDLIAGWTQMHTNDNHFILSTDTDYAQLLANNITIYDGIKKEIIKPTGHFDIIGNHITDKKTKELKIPKNPEFILFAKCIRGDSSDNVFSAAPGVRMKGSKNKIGIEECFADRNRKGWVWQNFMMQTWTDHNGEKKIVGEEYLKNKLLIDLTAQPENIRKIIEDTIKLVYSNPKAIGMVGLHFQRLCKKYGLERIAKTGTDMVSILAKPLTK